MFFNNTSSALSRTKAVNYLKGDAKALEDKDVFEFYVSLNSAEFQKLAETIEEKTANFERGVIEGTENLWNMMKAKVDSVAANNSIDISTEKQITFLQRDARGIATSFTDETGSRNSADEKGAFYIGDFKIATEFLLVESPSQAFGDE